MLTRKEKSLYRSELFRHLDGIAVAPTAHCLLRKGVIKALVDNNQLSPLDFAEQHAANPGYLNVALHTLASQGWLRVGEKQGNPSYTPTELGTQAFELFEHYTGVSQILKLSEDYHNRRFEKEPFDNWSIVAHDYLRGYELNPMENTIHHQILKHIEGVLVGPSVVALGMGGMFHKYFMETSFRAEEFHEDPSRFGTLLDFFTALGWFTKRSDAYTFTEKGLFFAKRASAYGVTVSYIPTFRKLDELIFGNPNVLWEVPEGAPEAHVDREMNVWGSGGAHSTYFKKVDEIILDLFNRPIEHQPKGIVDMGCGNGAYLEHLFNVIDQHTLRGTMLDEHPLFLVGADYNQAALKVTRANLIKADIWAKVIWGDIGRPDQLARDLKENYDITLSDLLNVRTFLDHNRVWEVTKPGDRVGTSAGAYASRGRMLKPNEVEENLNRHLEKWAPYVERFGLLIIELHTVAPELSAQHLGKTAVTAYNATHGYSDQYIVEIDVFNRIAAEAGLYPSEEHFVRFPDSDLATVSINLLRGKN